MRLLTRGSQTSERLALLLAFTSIRSEGMRAALSKHLVDGFSVEIAASMCCVATPNLYRALNRLSVIASHAESIKNYDLKHHHKSES